MSTLQDYWDAAPELAARMDRAEHYAREELEKLRKDAERYRWLKSRKSLDLRSGHGEWMRQDGTKFLASHYLAEGDMQHAPAESLDATIDAAMLVRGVGAA